MILKVSENIYSFYVAYRSTELMTVINLPRNSSGDEIANVNFLYDDMYTH